MRKNRRLRQEYLWRKEEEARSSTIKQQKKRLKYAIESGQHIPTEILKNEETLRQELAYDNSLSNELNLEELDNEYANVGIADPKVCITTSRGPSSKLKQFAKEMRLVVPNSVRVNRGGYKIKDILLTLKQKEFTDIIIVHENRGIPDGLTLCHLPHGPTLTFTLYNVVTRHDILAADPDVKRTVSEAYPNLIFENFTTKLGIRVKTALQSIFPVPKASETTRVMSFISSNDYISYRHHVFRSSEGFNQSVSNARNVDDIELEEIGPRFELQLYKITRGSVEQKEAEVEYIRRFYSNTAGKVKRMSHV